MRTGASLGSLEPGNLKYRQSAHSVRGVFLSFYGPSRSMFIYLDSWPVLPECRCTCSPCMFRAPAPSRLNVILLAKLSKSDVKGVLFACFYAQNGARDTPHRVKQMGFRSKRRRLFDPFCVICVIYRFCQPGWPYRAGSATLPTFWQNRKKVPKG